MRFNPTDHDFPSTMIRPGWRVSLKVLAALRLAARIQAGKSSSLDPSRSYCAVTSGASIEEIKPAISSVVTMALA